MISRKNSDKFTVSTLPFAHTLRKDVTMRETELANANRNVLVFMRDMDLSQRDTFLNFAKKYNPKCILDFRIAPRLDSFANSRLLAFKLFKDLKVEYYDFLGRSGISSKEELTQVEHTLASSIAELWLDQASSTRPIVLFFDNEEILHTCQRLLPELKKHTFENLKIANFRSGLLSFKAG